MFVIVFCFFGISCSTEVLQEEGKVTETESGVQSGKEDEKEPPEQPEPFPYNMPEGYDYEKIKSGFLEYLNFEAWFNPDEMPQEEHELNYEIVCSPERRGGRAVVDRIWIDCLVNDDYYRRYVCVPQTYQKRGIWYEEYHFKAQKLYKRTEVSELTEETGTLVCLGKDTVKVPAVTKPEFIENEEQKKEKEEIFDALKEELRILYGELLNSRENLVSLYSGLLAYELHVNGCAEDLTPEPDELFARLRAYGYDEELKSEFDELFANGYDEKLKLELIVSDFSTDKGFMPYSYLIINDEKVFECRFEVGTNSKNRGYAQYFDAFQVNYRVVQSLSIPDSCGSVKVFDGNQMKSLASIDAKTAMLLERIKKAAVFQYSYCGGITE